MIAAIGSVLGAAIAIATLAPFSIDVTGTWMPHIPWTMSFVVLTSVASLVWIATIVPTRIALRAQPIESVRVG